MLFQQQTINLSSLNDSWICSQFWAQRNVERRRKIINFSHGYIFKGKTPTSCTRTTKTFFFFFFSPNDSPRCLPMKQQSTWYHFAIPSHERHKWKFQPALLARAERRLLTKWDETKLFPLRLKSMKRPLIKDTSPFHHEITHGSYGKMFMAKWNYKLGR